MDRIEEDLLARGTFLWRVPVKPSTCLGGLVFGHLIYWKMIWPLEKEVQYSFFTKQSSLGLIAEWAQEMGCTQDLVLIANCLDFVVPEAKVSIDQT